MNYPFENYTLDKLFALIGDAEDFCVDNEDCSVKTYMNYLIGVRGLTRIQASDLVGATAHDTPDFFG